MFRLAYGKGPLFYTLRRKRKHGCAGNAVQDFAVKWVRDQNPIVRDDMRVLRATFCDPAIALHPRIVRTARNRLVFHHRGIQKLGCFYVRVCATDGDDDLTVQVNLDNLLTGLGNGELLQPNSVLGVTVWQSEQYLLLRTELQHSKQENASLRNELCVLKQHQQANAHQHQHQPPPPPTPQQARSLFHEGYVLSLEQKCTSHGTELAHLQAQVDDKTRALVWQMQQHDGTLRTLRTLHDDQFSKFEQSHSIEILKLKSEQDDTLSTCKQSHSIEVRDLKTHHASTEARSDVRAEQKLQSQHEAFLSEQRAQHAAHQLALSMMIIQKCRMVCL